MRRCRSTDLRHVLAIETASFADDAWPRELFVELMEECPRLFLLGVADGRIAGYVAAVVRGEAGDLVSIAVHPRHRGQGVAAAMMRRVLSLLQKDGIEQCWLMVRPDNAGAIRLYRAFGFVQARRVKNYYGRGADGLRMRVR